jgi:hypothetical protein
MIKRFFPLVLMLIWVPAALAYPPCKPGVTHLNLWAPGQTPPPGGPAPWFNASYEIFGDPNIVSTLRAGKCQDQMPVPGNHASTGALGLGASFLPMAAGIVSLPVVPTIAVDGLNLQYTLNFNLYNEPLLNTGDWMDVAQLDFAPDRRPAATGWLVSSVYRIRKIQRKAGTMAQVIESRVDVSANYATKSVLVESVVAEIPLTGASGLTWITLRWTQHAQVPIEAEPSVPTAPMYYVDSTMEVLDMGTQTVGSPDHLLYSTTLPIGLLDYNAPNASAYSSDFRVITGSLLDAKTL